MIIKSYLCYFFISRKILDMSSASFLTDIAVATITSFFFAAIMRFLRQPIVIGYILAGICLGPGIGFGLINNPEHIELISEIGLIFLLFIIGTELKVNDLVERGKDILLLSVFQIIIGFFLMFFIVGLLPFNFSKVEKIYLSFLLNLSSTLIVVKMLKDKFETQTLAGKITIGILIFQDLFATIFLAFQSNFEVFRFYQLIKSLSITCGLVIFAFLLSRYLFLKLITRHVHSIEFTVLATISYCFAISIIANHFGISKEMGALIAGFSIGNSPYSQEMAVRISSIRDFFVTLFFVSLGLKAYIPTMSFFMFSVYLLFFTFVIRVLSIVSFFKLFRTGIRPLFITAINLFPISEFALVVSSFGFNYGHISSQTQILILITMLLSSAISGYLINYSHQVYTFIAKLFNLEKIDESFSCKAAVDEKTVDVLILGFDSVSHELIRTIKLKKPLWRVIVADFNAGNMKKIFEMGGEWVYVDLSNYSSIKKLENLKPRFVFSTMTNMVLKGTDTLNLFLNVKSIFANSKIVFVSQDDNEHIRLVEAGANVINKSKILSQRFFREIVVEEKKKK